MENAPAKVLIFDTAWLGDVIFTTSLIGAARAAWPETELHALVAKRGELLVRHHPHLDQVWVYDKNGGDRSLGSMLRLARNLRQENFDVLLNAHPSFRSRLISLMSGIPVRVGYFGFGSSIAFTQRVPNSLHVHPDHADRRVDLLRKLVPFAEEAPLKVGFSDERAEEAADRLRELNPEVRPLLGLIPGSARRTKMWSSEGFAKIAARWIRERQGVVIVVGAEAERAVVESICRAAGDRCYGIIREPLDLVAAMLARCDSAIGNDTGVSFLAIAAGCPRVLVLYGCTQVNYCFPAPHRAIAAGVPCCLPPTGHGKAQCQWAETAWCMSQIPVERVWRELCDQ